MVLIKKEGSQKCLRIEQEELRITQADIKEIGVEKETYKIKEMCQTIYGMIKLVDSICLIVVKESKGIANLFGKMIYQA